MEKSIGQQVSEGRAGAELLRVLRPYFEQIIEGYTVQWRDPSGTPEEREDLFRKTVLVEDLAKEIQRVVDNGVIAEEIQKMKRSTNDAN